jgi:hypothetical protein
MIAVTLRVPPAIEERLVDWLLARGDVGEFTSSVVCTHGGDSHALSVAEQVNGRQRRAELIVELPAELAESLLEDLAAAFAATHVEYRMTPVLRSGSLAARR